MSSLQFEMTGHDVKLSNYQIYSNIAKLKKKKISLNASGRRFKKTKKTKENLGYSFASYS